MRILVIRLSSLGDVVLATLLVNRLRETYPEATIDFLTSRTYRELLDAIPGLDGRLTYGEEAPGQYDIVIDLQNNFRSRRLCRRYKPSRLFRFHRQRFNRFLRIHIPGIRKSLNVPPPVARQYLQTVTGLGAIDDGSKPRLTVPAEWIASVQKLMDESNLSADNLLLVAVGGRHQTKIWPREKWQELLVKAYEKGFRNFGIIGSISDVLAAEQIVKSSSFPIVTFAGKTDTTELVGLIASAKLLICGDSGPMHIAAAVGTPVVAIFGPTVQEFGFTPFTDKARVVEVPNLECRPCHPHGPEKCPLGHFRCMLDISPAMVLEKALELTTDREENK